MSAPQKNILEWIEIPFKCINVNEEFIKVFSNRLMENEFCYIIVYILVFKKPNLNEIINCIYLRVVTLNMGIFYFRSDNYLYSNGMQMILSW